MGRDFTKEEKRARVNEVISQVNDYDNLFNSNNS